MHRRSQTRGRSSDRIGRRRRRCTRARAIGRRRATDRMFRLRVIRGERRRDLRAVARCECRRALPHDLQLARAKRGLSICDGMVFFINLFVAYPALGARSRTIACLGALVGKSSRVPSLQLATPAAISPHAVRKASIPNQLWGYPAGFILPVSHNSNY